MIAHHSIILIKIMTIQTITWNIVVKKITENNVPLIQKRNFSRSVGRADSIIEDLHVSFQGCRNFIHTIYLVTQETTVLWIAMLTSLWLPLDTFITRTLTQFFDFCNVCTEWNNTSTNRSCAVKIPTSGAQRLSGHNSTAKKRTDVK